MQQARLDDMRVADYVLGLMDAREIAQFERELRHDPDLAERVEFWRARVAQADTSRLVTPQEQMRQRIADGFVRRTGGQPVAAPAVERTQFGRWVAISLASFACGVALGAVMVWLTFH